MREIKFRIWDNKKSNWYEPTYHAYAGRLEDLSISPAGDLTMRRFKDGTRIEESIHESAFPNRFVIQQFTGLKENCCELPQDNKEIYEGDIIMPLVGEKLVVEWNDDTCQWQYSDGSPINDGERYACHRVIVGNIFQNPELIPA